MDFSRMATGGNASAVGHDVGLGRGRRATLLQVRLVLGQSSCTGGGGGRRDRPVRLPRRRYGRQVINGAHVIIYSRDAEADRAFFRDTLGYHHVDAGHGWLIFRLPPAELAVHPTEGEPAHELFLMCDDVEATMAELTAKGVEFTIPITEERWGLRTALRLPGGGELGLYEPRHPVTI
ncbi:VOC family protein [Micromonospora sp. CB01531]|uniref:VOC family protein n=1 Tax=Micromonospora sp. CB01531 TaxID=1718947 RepID=UPI001F51875E|nr:VOC family protein [Micromonospora sp. CB01531]